MIVKARFSILTDDILFKGSIKLTRSISAFCLDFQINSPIATRTPMTKPARRTRNIPPIFSTPSSFASSLLASSLTHLPCFHHLFFISNKMSSSWSLNMALVISSRIGAPITVKINQRKRERGHDTHACERDNNIWITSQMFDCLLNLNEDGKKKTVV